MHANHLFNLNKKSSRLFTVCGKAIVLLAHTDIEEVSFTGGVLQHEFDGPGKGMHVVNEGFKNVFVTGPDEADVINVAPPTPRSAGSRS